MGAFITGNTSNTQATVKYSGIQIGTSQFDIPIAIFWGQRRLSYNCVWYNDFQRHSVSPKGKGGSKGQQYDYTAAVILALCEGVVDSIINVWTNGSTTTTTTLSKLGFTFFDGSPTQAPWSFVTTNYPDQALSYALTSYLAAPKLDLGNSASVPENAFECRRLNGFTDTLTTPGWTNPTTHANTPGVDCSMADIIPDFLTNVQYGMGFESGDFPDLTAFRQYQDGQGLYFSPCLVSQETATDIINRWAQITNTWIYWAGTQFAFVPLGDSPVGSYVPALDAAYDLGVDDFIGGPPLKVPRKDPADAHNRTVIQFTDRTLGYVSNNAEYKDQTLVDQYGTRDNSSTQVDEICVPTVANAVAQLVGKRTAYIRNLYQFKVSDRFIRLMPGAIVTLTEPNVGLSKFRVRITKVDEDEALNLTLEAEELPALIGTYFPPPGANATFVPQFPNGQIDPGDVNTPCVVEPDSSFTSGVPQLMISASGGANFGGCEVFVAFNGTTNYQAAGRITSNGAQGVLTANLPSHADPDTVDTLSVNTAESLTVPQPVTNDDADALRTLSYVSAQPTIVGGASVLDNTGELLAFGSTATTGTYAADLTYLRRGQLGTSPSAHSTGDQFTVLDSSGLSGSTLLYNLPAEYIGGAISFKFCAFNGFGQSQQDLSTVVEYQYTPIGRGYGGGTGGVPTTPSTPTVTGGSGQIFVRWPANPPTDNVTQYQLWAASGTGSPFGSAVKTWSGTALNYTHTGLSNGTAFTYFVVAANAVGSSTNSSGASATAGAQSPDSLPSATVSTVGVVKPDGTTITVDGTGTITASTGSTGANPTATAGPAVINGTAATFMRSDAAPAVQKASNTQYGIVIPDGTTITAALGVISAVGGGGGGGGSPLVNGDVPGPAIVSDGTGQTITVPLGSSAPFADTRLKYYLTVGVIAGRPATPVVASGSAPIYYATDTSSAYIWTGSSWLGII